MSYSSIGLVRAEGFDATIVSDATLQSKLLLADRFIEQVCGQWFEAREFPDTAPFEVNGSGHRILHVPIPIISVSRVRVLSRSLGGESWVDLPTGSFYVFNRHMTGQTGGAGDDRDDPRIELIDSREGRRYLGRYLTFGVAGPAWPAGPGSVQLSGWFGYTDPSSDYGEGYDYTATGTTPLLIQRAATLLVVRDLETLRRRSRRQGWRNDHRIVAAHTKDQGYTLGAPAQDGWATGDPEIDSLLAPFIRGYGRVGAA